jgi:transcriptional regulator GlxA family with amidase domain
MNISILLHQNTSVSMAMLMKEILDRASDLDETKKPNIQFISSNHAFVKINECSIDTVGKVIDTDILIVPPFNQQFRFDLTPFGDEIELISNCPSSTLKVSACMGALLLASASVLDYKNATTHWKAREFVHQNFPLVEWDLKSMICDSGNVITSGGFLAAVDVTFYLVNRIFSSKIAHELGAYLLVDSIRQKQSIYAIELINKQNGNEFTQKFDSWIETNIGKDISIKELAAEFLMSERNFYRFFVKSFGISPNKMIQLKRIEKAKYLLQHTNKNIDSILEEIGFVDVSSFRKLFHREIGMTPYEYRKRITL